MSFLLASDGGLYTSQDADLVPGEHSDAYFKLGDNARRKKGIPRVDKHQYARENGWVIEALCIFTRLRVRTSTLLRRSGRSNG